MGTLFRLFFLASVGLILSWAGFLLLPSVAEQVAILDEEWFHGAFPAGSHGGPVEGPGTGRGPILVPTFLSAVPGPLTGGWRLVLRHLRVAGDLLPFFVVFISASILVGMFARERLRLGTAYASPTAGFMAKRLMEMATVSLILWSFAPIPAPYWAFYPLGLAAIVGSSAYVGNLPLRL